MNQRSATVVAVLAIAALFASAAIRSGSVAPEWQDAGRALLVVGLVLAAYDRLLWRWIPVPGRPPVLRGTWRMTHTVEEIPDRLLERYPDLTQPKTTYLRIEQTASAIRARFLFPDGRSVATAAILSRDPDRGDRLLLFYEFEPENPITQPPRKGASEVEIRSIPRVTLWGRYWNNAGIRGELQSEGRSDDLFEHFRDAEAEEYAPVAPGR